MRNIYIKKGNGMRGYVSYTPKPKENIISLPKSVLCGKLGRITNYQCLHVNVHIETVWYTK